MNSNIYEDEALMYALDKEIDEILDAEDDIMQDIGKAAMVDQLVPDSVIDKINDREIKGDYHND